MLIQSVFAGFGGQGILRAGQIIAYAGMAGNLYVSWLPSYGPEMRGGTANVAVVLADEPVASPVVSTPSVVIAMNRPSLEKFAPMMQTGGKLIINSSLIDIVSERDDLIQYQIRANDIAQELGNPRAANMVILGVFQAVTGIIPDETVEEHIRQSFAAKPQFIELNIACFRHGKNSISQSGINA
ncbi:MAG: 2-oxoacid:acceptor oxidoreductase family protein [Candidatus Delongbacteria bacterium]|nr:2-oxoacid:acceptor oxidoreductase family protein [Candidatus Delongbacteria bacterium]